MESPDRIAVNAAPVWLRTSVVLAVGFGLACRLSQYVANTSLWHDEAFVALNVVDHGVLSLFGRLKWSEVSPPGFLAVEKLVASGLGRSEYALRLVPLSAGIAGTIAAALLARRVAAGAAWLWAVVLVGASEKLIVQSNEVKHFTLDFLCASLVTLAAIGILREPRRGLLAMWAVVGASGLWVSFATAFVFAATSVSLAPRLMRGGDVRIRAGFVGANLAVALSAALLWLVVRGQLDDRVLGFWSPAFPDLGGPVAFAGWLAGSVLGFFNYFWQPLGIVVAVTAVFGAVTLWRAGRRGELVLLCLPTVLSLAAAFVHRWPFGGNQHMVFAGPSVLLLAGIGAEHIRSGLERGRRAVGAAFVALFLLPGVVPAAFHVAVPRLRHDSRAVIQFVERNRRPEDQLLVFCPAEFEFYTGRVPDPPADPDPARRVWFVGTRSDGEPFPNQAFLDMLASRRIRILSTEEYGAAAYLFGMEPAASTPR